MDLFREEMMPPLPACRYVYPVLPAALAFAGWSLAALACFWIGWRAGVGFDGGGVPGFVAWWCGAWLTLFALLWLRTLRARMRPSNWLAAVSSDGLYLKFRSYQNYHFPREELAAVFIPWREIQGVRASRREEAVPGIERGSSYRQRRELVEAKLSASRPKLVALGEALARHAGRRKGMKFNHFPVQLTADDRLQILWEAKPGVQSFLSDASAHAKVQKPVSAAVDFTALTGLPAEGQRERLAQLAASGDTISVIKLARQLYGFDTTRAKAFAEELRASRSTPARSTA